MSLLSYLELCELVDTGVIEGVDPECINASSIDVHLGPILHVEAEFNSRVPDVDIALRDPLPAYEVDLRCLPYEKYRMPPGQFLLAATTEIFHLPDNITAEFRLKSSGARSGLNNLFACHCDPGWNNSTLTLELHNVLQHHNIVLTHGMRIGQMLFHRHAVPVPEDRSYAVRGRYNGDLFTQGVKP